MDVLKVLKWSGLTGGIVYWLFVAWGGISRNGWFSFFHNALSDLGDPPSEATAPWIYNYGLIVTSIFVLAFAIYLLLNAKNKLKRLEGLTSASRQYFWLS